MAARERLQALTSWLDKAGWDNVLHLLHDANMRYMSDMSDGQTEGTRDLSWIWKMPGILGKRDDNLQGCKSVTSFNLASDKCEHDRLANQMVQSTGPRGSMDRGGLPTQRRNAKS
jgi:hypothetical protein